MMQLLSHMSDDEGVLIFVDIVELGMNLNTLNQVVKFLESKAYTNCTVRFDRYLKLKDHEVKALGLKHHRSAYLTFERLYHGTA